MTPPRILLPADLFPDGTRGLPDDVPEWATYTSETLPERPALASVEFFVPIYMGPPSTYQIVRDMPALQVVQSLTAGVDHLAEVVPPNVTLARAGGVHDASTAEQAVALALTSLRGLDVFARAMPQGRWIRSRNTSLADRRVLVVGAGQIGRAIAMRLRPFEVELTMVGRHARPASGPDPEVFGAERLPELLPTSEVVILAVPLTPQTLRMVDADFLQAMPEGALLVNVARGQVVDTEALLEAVTRGHVRAALDVTDPEPLPGDHPLWNTDGVFISPHVGGNTTAFLPRARRLVAAQITRWQRGEPLEFTVR